LICFLDPEQQTALRNDTHLTALAGTLAPVTAALTGSAAAMRKVQEYLEREGVAP
jgi:hypothetical protein